MDLAKGVVIIVVIIVGQGLVILRGTSFPVGRGLIEDLFQGEVCRWENENCPISFIKFL